MIVSVVCFYQIDCEKLDIYYLHFLIQYAHP